MKRCLLLLLVPAVLAGCPGSPRILPVPPAPPATTHKPEPVRSVDANKPQDAGAGSGLHDAGASADFAPPGWGETRRLHGKSACEPAVDTLERAESAILAAPPSGSVAPASRWDHRHAPRYLARVAERFALNGTERRMLFKNGFVVPARLETRGYTVALHEIYQSQLPIYVSADAVLHAIFRSHEAVVSKIELRLVPHEQKLLDGMHAALPRETLPADVAHDLDVYLTVARSLLADAPVKSVLGTDAEVRRLFDAAHRGTGGLTRVRLFGRERIVDFSRFEPRGYYATAVGGALQPYFRASTWLSLIEFNLVSRGGRSSQPGVVPNRAETPREAVDALALARLARDAGVLGELATLDRAWTLIAGKREDVSLPDLLRLGKGIGKLELPGTAELLKRRIGSGFVRTARVHYLPQGSWPLPVIASVLGPRILPDTAALSHLVHPDVPGRDVPHVADVAFLLGSNRARRYLASDLAAHPVLRKKLASGRAQVAASAAPGLFGAWFDAIRALARKPSGHVPSYMQTGAFRDSRLSSIAAAYGQLRHGAVLMAGQPYSEGGCEIPDGYLDPAVGVYDAIGKYARRGRALAAATGSSEARTHFTKLERIARVLSRIARDELAGRALSEAERDWLGMVVEVHPPTSDSPGQYNGWYFDLFPDIDAAFKPSSFVADWFTGSNTRTVVLAGATAPRFGLFVVDTGGPPRVMVGPVARGFEARARIDERPRSIAALHHLIEPWARSYVAPRPHAPALRLVYLGSRETDGVETERFAVQSLAGALGRIDLLGHHRNVLATLTSRWDSRWSVLELAFPDDKYPERVRIVVGPFSAEAPSMYDDQSIAFGGLEPLTWKQVQALRARLEARAKRFTPGITWSRPRAPGR